jgi:hypothetical protein
LISTNGHQVHDPIVYLLRSRDSVYAKRARLCTTFAARIVPYKASAAANAPDTPDAREAIHGFSVATMRSVLALIDSFKVDSSPLRDAGRFTFSRVQPGRFLVFARDSVQVDQRVWVHRVDVNGDTVKADLGATDSGLWSTWACGVNGADLADLWD